MVMLTISYFNDVTIIRTTRIFAGKKLFSSMFYRYGESLFDAGLSGRNGIENVVSGVSGVYVTHPHIDHIGGLCTLGRLGIRAYAHKDAIDKIRSPSSPFMLRMMTGAPKPTDATTCPDKFLASGEDVFSIHTPGHCREHLCFHVPSKGYVFTGDLVLNGKLEWVSDEVRMWDAIDSLKLLRSLQPRVLFPGHGTPFEDPDELLKTKIAAYEDLGKKVLEMHDDGIDDQAIRDALLGGENMFSRLSGGKFSKLNLVKSYLGTLVTR